MVAQEAHETSGANVGSDDEVRLERDTDALDRKGRKHCTVVRMRKPGNFHVVLSSGGVLEAPHVAVRRVLVRKARVVGEIGGRVRRTVSSQIGG
jgi:hypothetical protein